MWVTLTLLMVCMIRWENSGRYNYHVRWACWFIHLDPSYTFEAPKCMSMVHNVGLRFSVGFGCTYLSPHSVVLQWWSSSQPKSRSYSTITKVERHQFKNLIASSIKHIQSCSTYDLASAAYVAIKTLHLEIPNRSLRNWSKQLKCFAWFQASSVCANW